MEKLLVDYEKKNGIKVEISYFGENDCCVKLWFDVLIGVGLYQIYYVDEVNVVEFVLVNWIVLFLKYYLKDYDYDDFLFGCCVVVSYNGVVYFVLLIGGGDFLFYCCDLFDVVYILVLKMFDQFVVVIRKLNVLLKLYGWVVCGQCGLGMNVWCWLLFMFGMGGVWIDKGGQFVFNLLVVVKVMQFYSDLFKYVFFGLVIYDWSNVFEVFCLGKVVFMIELMLFVDWMEDVSKLSVVGKVGYMWLFVLLLLVVYGYGFVILVVGVKDDCMWMVVGCFIVWVISKDQEQVWLCNGVFSDYNCFSMIVSLYFKQYVVLQIQVGLNDINFVMQVMIWWMLQWLDIGDNFGIVFEQVFIGMQMDIWGMFDDVDQYVKDVFEYGVCK